MKTVVVLSKTELFKYAFQRGDIWKRRPFSNSEFMKKCGEMRVKKKRLLGQTGQLKTFENGNVTLNLQSTVNTATFWYFD